MAKLDRNKLIQAAFVDLQLFGNSLPEGQEVTEFDVGAFHHKLQPLIEMGLEIEGLKIPESALSHRPISYPREEEWDDERLDYFSSDVSIVNRLKTVYSKDRRVEYKFFMNRLNVVLKYLEFEIQNPQKQNRPIGFQQKAE